MAGNKYNLFHSNTVRWVLAIIITLASAIYQRMTGPTYPLDGKVSFEGAVIQYELTRSHGGPGDQIIHIDVPDTTISGFLVHRRYPTNEQWTTKEMQRQGKMLIGAIPHQSPAGKVAYYLVLSKNDNQIKIPEDQKVITRFKGAVPTEILIPHIIFMFLAMLFSTRTGIEALDRTSNLRKLTLWTFGLLTVGGMILGPIVQKYAFGALWTGVPFGWDLTDNKTLVAFLAWGAALIASRKGRKAHGWVLSASIITLIIFVIPHSLLGSELQYEDLPQ